MTRILNFPIQRIINPAKGRRGIYIAFFSVSSDKTEILLFLTLESNLRTKELRTNIT